MTARRRAAAAVAVAILALPFLVGGEGERLDDRLRRRTPGDFVHLRRGWTRFELLGPAPAEVVVFVHGTLVPGLVWSETAKELREAGYRTLVYDQFGRGYSDRPMVDYDLPLLHGQLEGLLAKLGLRARVHLVGLSMGAAIATEFALANPKRAASVTLIAPAGIPAGHDDAPSWLRLPLVGDYLVQVVGERHLLGEIAAGAGSGKRVPSLLKSARPQMEYSGFKRAVLSSLRKFPLGDYEDRYRELGRSQTPVTFVWGSEDSAVAAGGPKAAHELAPRASLRYLDGAGEHVPFEAPQATASLLAEILAPLPAAKQTGELRPPAR